MVAIVWLILAPPVAGQPVDARSGAVEATVIAQVRLLEQSGPAAVYDRVHPDVRNLLPRRAFVAWLDVQPFRDSIGDPVIEGISFEAWTSPTTGVPYPHTALVAFSQDAVGASSTIEVTTSWRLAFDGQQWRWLPDIPVADFDSLRAAVVDFPGGYVTPFRQSPYIAIDRFWQGELYAANRAYLPPEIVPVASDEVETGCGTVQQVRRLAIFYCVYDATIYFDPAFRDEVVDESGPFGWTAVVAHEWGHHAQALLGVDAADPIDLELQADCLAAVFAQDQLARGEIGEDEVADAEIVIRLAGDTPGTDTATPGAHGSAAERLEWFQAGFDRGFAGCSFDLPPS